MKAARLAIVIVLCVAGLTACGGRTQLEGADPVMEGGTEAAVPLLDSMMSACVAMKELNRDRSCTNICTNDGKTCRDDCQTEHGPVAVTYYPDNASCQQSASYEYGHGCDQAFGAVNRGRVITYARCCCR